MKPNLTKDDLKMSDAELASKVRLQMEDKPGDDDHEFVHEVLKLTRDRARATGKDNFAAFQEIVTENGELGRRFLAYVFEDVG